MAKQKRGERGRFTPKADEYRQVRSLRLTDKTWEILGCVADSQAITRADLIEQSANSGLLGQQTTSEKVDLQQVEEVINQVLSDPLVTRNGKDRGSVRRALEALLQRLS
jgi:hypothetical protein